MLVNLQVPDAKIDNIIFNEENNSVILYVSKDIIECECPSCKAKTKRIHDYKIQKIKHTPIFGSKCFIYLKKTRLYCSNCGKKFYMNYNNIVNPRFRSSNFLFTSIISYLQNYSLTLKDISKMFYVSTGVVKRYMMFFSYLMQWENITTLPKRIGIDEFKGNCDGSKYLFHIYNLDTGETVTILKTRKYEDLVKFFDSIENRNEIELVTMDLYEPFRKAVKAKLKKAEIVADKFHYTRIIAKALDELRLEIWRNAKGKDKKFLKCLKTALLKDIENIEPDKLLDHEAKLNTAFEINGQLKYGYQLYQSFLRIKDGDTYQERVKRFSDWLSDASSSTIKSFKSASETLLKWNKEIINSFKTKYTNSATEGKNNKIKTIKRLGFGYRTLSSLKIMIKLKDCKV